MSLASRITDLAGAVRDKINLMVPRLLPAGGASGQILSKTSASDYATGWIDAPSGGGGLSDGDKGGAGGRGGDGFVMITAIF